MSRERAGWIVLSRELVADLLDLLDAEIGAARQELAVSWRRAGLIVAFFAGALALAFWVVALVAYTLVEVVSLWWPPWAAALTVTALFLLLAAVLVLLARWRIRRLANPLDVAVRRLREHIDWWRREVTVTVRPVSARPGGAEAPDEESPEEAP